MAINNQQFIYSIRFAADTSGLRQALIDIATIQTRLNNISTNNMTREFSNARLEAQRLSSIIQQSWDSKLNHFNMGKLNSGIKQAYGSMKQFRTAMESAGASGEQMFSAIVQSSLTSNLQIKQGSRILHQFANTLRGHVRWFISSKITNTIVGSLSKAYNFTKDLDKALTNIRIVTTKSKEEMADFAKYAQKAATSLSTSTNAYAQASLIYYQQGLSDNEVKARTDTTMKVANVTGMSASEASEQLTALWNGYKVSAKETELYVDKLSKVASTTASDLQELATSISKVASTASTTGVNIDQLVAQMATVISVTRQAPESVGNAFKTIYARIGDLQVNGEDESGVSLGKVSSAMKELGINILNQKGELRDLGIIIEETMQKWNGWTKAQKNAAAIAMAGTRQYNNLYALFENQDKYNESLKVSTEATGTLQEQQEKYADSTVARLQKMSAAAEELYLNLFNQDATKGIISAFTFIIEKIGAFTSGLGKGSNALIQLGSTAAIVFNKQIAQSIQRNISNLQAWKDNLAIRAGNVQLAKQAIVSEGIRGAIPRKVDIETQFDPVRRYQYLQDRNIRRDLASEYQRYARYSRYMSPQQQREQINSMRELNDLRNAQSQRAFFNYYEEHELGLTPEQRRGMSFTDIQSAYRQRETQIEQWRQQAENRRDAAEDELRNFPQRVQDARDYLNNTPPSDIDAITRRQQQESSMVQEDIEEYQKTLQKFQKAKRSNTQLKYARELLGLHHERGVTIVDEDERYDNVRQLLQRPNADLVDDPQAQINAAKQLSSIQNSSAAYRLQAESALTAKYNDELNTANRQRNEAQEILRTETSRRSELERNVQLRQRELEATNAIAEQQTIALNRARTSRAADAEHPEVSEEEELRQQRIQADLARQQQEAKFRKTIGNIINISSTVISMLSTASTVIDTFSDSMAKTSDKAQAAATAFMSLGTQTSMMLMGISPIVAAVVGAGSAIGAIISLVVKSSAKKDEEKQAELLDQVNTSYDNVQEYNEKEKQLVSLKAKYNVLKEGVSATGENISLTNTAYQEFLSIQNEIGSLIPDLVQGYDDQGNAILKMGNAIELGADALKKYKEEAASGITFEAFESYGEDFRTQVKKIKEKQKDRVETAYSEEEDIENQYDNINADLNGYLEYYKDSYNIDPSELTDESKAALIEKIMSGEEGSKYIDYIYDKEGGAVPVTVDGQRRFIKRYEGINLNERGLEDSYYMTDEEGNLVAEKLDSFNLLDSKKSSADLDLYTTTQTEIERKSLAEVKEKRAKVALLSLQNTQSFIKDLNEEQISVLESYGANLNEDLSDNTFYTKIGKLAEVIKNDKNAATRIKDLQKEKETLSASALNVQLSESYSASSEAIKSAIFEDEYFSTVYGVDRTTFNDRVQSLAAELKKEYLKDDEDASEEAIINTLINSFTVDELMEGSSQKIGQVSFQGTKNLKDVENIVNYQRKSKRRVQQAEEKAVDYRAINDVLQPVTEANEKLQSGKKLSDEELKDVFAYTGNNEEITNMVDRLKNIRDKTSEEFKMLFAEYQQKLEELSIKTAVNAGEEARDQLAVVNQVILEQLGSSGDKWKKVVETWEKDGEEGLEKLTDLDPKIVPQLVLSLEERDKFQEQIEDADYNVTVSVNADIESDINNALSTIDEMVSLSDILSKGLTISISDMKSIIEQGYGAMLEGAESAADGQIALNEEVVNAFIDGKQAEIAAEMQKQREVALLKIEQLEAEKTIALQELELIEKGLNAESAEEKAVYLAKVTLLDQERENIQKYSEIEYNSKKSLSEDEQQLSDNLTKYLLGQNENLTKDFISLDQSLDNANKVVAEHQIQNYQEMAKAAQAYANENWDKVLKQDGTISYDTVIKNKELDSNVKKWLETEGIELSESIAGSEYTLIGGILETAKNNADVIDSVLNNEKMTLNDRVQAIENMIGAQKGIINAAQISAYANVDVGQENLQEAVGKTNDLLDEEIDRFHYIDVLLDRVSRSMDKLKDAQERLVGAGLVDNLQQQIDLLEQENRLQEEKRNIAINRANELRGTLANYGAVFDEEGAVANYTDFLINLENQMNTIITEYNSMSKAQQKVNEDTYKDLKNTYDDVKDDLKEYEDIVNDTLTDIEDATYENKNAITELKIALSKVESDLALENIDIKKSFRDYRSAVIDRIGDKDFQRRINNNLADLEDYYNINGEGKSQIYRQKVENLLEQKRQMESTGSASIYGTDDAQLREDLKQAMSDLMSSQQDFVTKLEDTWNIIVTGAEDAFAVNSNFYENQNAELDFQSKLLGLVGGKTAANQEKIYKAQIELNKGQIEAAKKETNFWNNQLELAKANNAGIDKIRELEDKANEARKQENNLVISSIEDLQNSYKAVIKTTLDENFKAIDDLKDRYDWVKTLNEPWLDDTTRMYEIQKFNLEVKAEIDDTTSEYAQKKLNAVLNDQLEILRTKDKLTQNDVDRANKILDLTKKQIALEEARQNKTQMRLRRDSQGNYSFQYTANEEDINNKTKEYLEATQDIYNMEKEYERETLELMFDFAKTARERLEKVLTDINLTQEEQQAEALRIYQETEEQMKALGDENHYARELLLRDLYEFVLPSLYSTNEENFIQSLEIENSALTTWKELFIQGWIDVGNTGKMTLDTLSATGTAFYQNLSDLDRITMVETILPEFTESLQIMMDKFTEPDGFNEVTNYAFSECIRLCQEYQQEFNNLGAVADYNFGQIHNGNWDTIVTTEAVRSKVVEVNDALQTQIKKYNDLAWSVWNVEQQFSTFADDTDVFVKGANTTLTAWTAAFGGLTNMLRAWSSDLEFGMSHAGMHIDWGNAYEAAAGQARDLMNNSVTDISNSSNKKQTKTTKSGPPKGYYTGFDEEIKAYGRTPPVSQDPLQHYTDNINKSIEFGKKEASMTFDGVTYKNFSGNKYSIKSRYGSGLFGGLDYVSSTIAGKPLDFIEKLPDGSVVFKVHGAGIASDLVLDAKFVKAGVLKSSVPYVQQQLRSFDTGGYTGIWNNSLGKLAVLHEKEIVLNKKDTANLLSTVQIVRDLSPIIQTLNNNLNNRLTYLQSQFTTPSKIINNSSTESNSENVKQYFTINADFPNVENVKDIKEAFEYLSTYGQQYINRRY